MGLDKKRQHYIEAKKCDLLIYDTFEMFPLRQSQHSAHLMNWNKIGIKTFYSSFIPVSDCERPRFLDRRVIPMVSIIASMSGAGYFKYSVDRTVKLW